MIFNAVTKAKDLFYKNASSGLKAGDVQEAIDETKGLVDQIANNQIPQKYLEATVDRYVAENHGGLATKEDLEETAADLKSDLSEISVNKADKKVTEGMYDIVPGEDGVEIGFGDQ